MASKLKEAYKIYNQYLKEIKKNIKSGNYDEANKYVQLTRNKVREIQKEVSSIDVNLFGDIKGWILSILIGMVENIVPNILIGISAKQNITKIMDGMFDDANNMINQIESGAKPSMRSVFRKVSKNKFDLSFIGRLGQNMKGTNELVHLLTNIYGIGKTIYDKGSVTQAINTFRSKILAQFAMIDTVLGLFQKDIERLKRKNS